MHWLNMRRMATHDSHPRGTELIARLCLICDSDKLAIYQQLVSNPGHRHGSRRTFSLESRKSVEIRHQNAVETFHDDTHAYGQGPEDGHRVCLDGIAKRQVVFISRSVDWRPIITPIVLVAVVLMVPTIVERPIATWLVQVTCSGVVDSCRWVC